jgi:hypothetical protein
LISSASACCFLAQRVLLATSGRPVVRRGLRDAGAQGAHLVAGCAELVLHGVGLRIRIACKWRRSCPIMANVLSAARPGWPSANTFELYSRRNPGATIVDRRRKRPGSERI